MIDQITFTDTEIKIRPHHGTGHVMNTAFYDNLLSYASTALEVYDYYGQEREISQRSVGRRYQMETMLVVPYVWISGGVNPQSAFRVPYYDDKVLFPQFTKQLGKLYVPKRFGDPKTWELTFQHCFPCAHKQDQLYTTSPVCIQPSIQNIGQHEPHVLTWWEGSPFLTPLGEPDFGPLKRYLREHVCLGIVSDEPLYGLPYCMIAPKYYIVFNPAKFVQVGPRSYEIPANPHNYTHAEVTAKGVWDIS